MKLILKEKQEIDRGIYLFTFKPEIPLMWKAGQQMLFTLPHKNPDNLGIRRTLSIASAPYEEKILILTHCGERCSTFKKALREMQHGQSIEASKPEGSFIIEDLKEEYTFIAAGVGIAPFRAILLDLDYHNLPINCVLMYSHTSEKFPFKEEMEELLERHNHFRVFYSIAPEEHERGRIKEIITGLEDHPVYMSGIYVRKIAQMLDSRDKTPRRLVHKGELMSVKGRQAEIEKEEDSLMALWGE